MTEYMLAEKKTKVKISVNPRGNTWLNDNNKFGQKMLEKMGWSKGKGLGVKEDGITECLRLKHKTDNEGIGWIEKDNFGELATDYEKVLAQLNAKHRNNLNSEAETSPSQSSQELEEEPKPKMVLKIRHRYSKVRRARDASSYSKEDFAKIFAVKLEDLDDSKQLIATNKPEVEDGSHFPSLVPFKREEEDDFSARPSFSLKVEKDVVTESACLGIPTLEQKEKKAHRLQSQRFNSSGFIYSQIGEEPAMSSIKEDMEIESLSCQKREKKNRNKRKPVQPEDHESQKQFDKITLHSVNEETITEVTHKRKKTKRNKRCH